MSSTACDDQFNDPPIETSDTEARPYVGGTPENIRAGDPYDDPAFERLAREHDVWGRAESALCAVFWLAGKAQPPSGRSASLAFDDAVRIARGCTDYGGGYRSEPELFEAYQGGISTVVAALTAAGKRGLADSQVRALHFMGAPPAAARVSAEQPSSGQRAGRAGAPDRIFLVIGEGVPANTPFSQLAEVAWCPDRVNDTDIEYVRAQPAATSSFNEWWANGGSKVVNAAADERGWQGAAEVGYLAGGMAAQPAAATVSADAVLRDAIAHGVGAYIEIDGQQIHIPAEVLRGEQPSATAPADGVRAALTNLVREAQAVADDYHRPRYARLDDAIASARAALAAPAAPQGPIHTCGGLMVRNPHPDAGRPRHHLNIGYEYECVPCLVKSRHGWAQRALKAETALREAAAQASGQAAPSDDEIETLARDYCDDPTVGAIVFTSTRDCVDFARALLSRYGQAPAASPDFPHYEMAFICRVLEGDRPEKVDLDTALGMARSVRVALLKERAAQAPAASAEPSDEHLIETGCYQTVIERHSQPAASAEPAINGYTCTVPDDCETLHWRGQILSMNELASMAQPAVGEEIHVHIEGQDVLTLPLASSGMGTPRFVVHVPAQPAASAEPYAWMIDGSNRTWFGKFSEIEARAEARRCGGTCTAFPIFRGVQPAASAEPVPVEIERLAINRYRPVPAGALAYKVVAGDGSRSLFSGTKDECQIVARKLTEAFLDGAHVAINAAPVAAQAPQHVPMAAAGPEDDLYKFYGVETDAALIAAQQRHIEKLQARIGAAPSLAPQRPREG